MCRFSTAGVVSTPKFRVVWELTARAGRERTERYIVCGQIITSHIWWVQFSKYPHFETIFIPSVLQIEYLLCLRLWQKFGKHIKLLTGRNWVPFISSKHPALNSYHFTEYLLYARYYILSTLLIIKTARIHWVHLNQVLCVARVFSVSCKWVGLFMSHKQNAACLCSGLSFQGSLHNKANSLGR